MTTYPYGSIPASLIRGRVEDSYFESYEERIEDNYRKHQNQ
jgi:hypothetical protein